MRATDGNYKTKKQTNKKRQVNYIITLIILQIKKRLNNVEATREQRLPGVAVPESRDGGNRKGPEHALTPPTPGGSPGAG